MTVEKSNSKEGFGLSAIWLQLEQVRYVNRAEEFQHLIVQALGSFIKAPVATTLSLLGIASALFILGLCLLVLQNVNSIVQTSSQQVSVSVYLNDAQDLKGQSDITEAIEQILEVEKIEFWSKERALKEFSSSLSEYPEMLAGLSTDNPLPASLELKLKPNLDIETLGSIVKRIRELPGVLQVGYAQEIYEQTRKVFSFFKSTAFAVVAILLLITAFLVASTVRLSLLQRVNELSIMRLVGATTNFIQIPCLVEGLVFGLGGALLGIIGLFFFYQGFLISIQDLENYLPALTNLEFLRPLSITFIIMLGVAVGLISSYLASRKIVDA